MLQAGIYEQVLNKLISREIDSSLYIVKTESIDPEEAAKVLAQYLTLVIAQALENVKDKGGNVENQIALCNRLVDTLVSCVGEESLANMSIEGHAKMLLALVAKQNSAAAINEKIDIIRPVTSIAASSLFTGSLHEPSMLSELKKEILSCDRTKRISNIRPQQCIKTIQ